MEPFIHPETQEGEVFFINATARQFELMQYATKRKGSAAYDGLGNKLIVRDWFPVFLERSEFYDLERDLRQARQEWTEMAAVKNI